MIDARLELLSQKLDNVEPDVKEALLQLWDAQLTLQLGTPCHPCHCTSSTQALPALTAPVHETVTINDKGMPITDKSKPLNKKILAKMKPPELLKMCQAAGIVCKQRKPVEYYMDLLLSAEAERAPIVQPSAEIDVPKASKSEPIVAIEPLLPLQPQIGATTDTSVSYEDMTPRELYNLCKSRGIAAFQKQSAVYYVELLLEDDEPAQEQVSPDDDWGNESDTESGAKETPIDEEDEWEL